jgi:Ca2+-transporting ATPase
MKIAESNITGLTQAEIIASRLKYGTNQLNYKKENKFLNICKSIVKEPMILLLLITSIIYFISGEIGNGIFLASAIIFVAMISIFQDSRSRLALEKLKELTTPKCKVIRDNIESEISIEDLVVGDYLISNEGSSVAADSTIIQCYDFSVNESILTGESLAIFKNTSDKNCIYRGTTIASGRAISEVTAIGNSSKIGKIGKSIEGIREEKTPLELQISDFVKKMVAVGFFVFIIVWIINYLKSYDLGDSLLKALTLAMSILPEEIPVAFTTFMALGAWRLMQIGVVVRQMKTVETLGSASVICVDKTGTITENKMSIAKLYDFTNNKIFNQEDCSALSEIKLVEIAMWASEPTPFDAMEIAIHSLYAKTTKQDERGNYLLAHEYPLDGKPPMMTHVFKNEEGERKIAAKGAPEAIINVSNLSSESKNQILKIIEKLAGEGYRLLAVGISHFSGELYPKQQQELPFEFLGLIAFYDPPKSNITKVLSDFYKAGIAVKIITGDNSITTKAIAMQIGFKNFDKALTGEELMLLSDEQLKIQVNEISIFTRMFPEAKLRIINALKANNEIVAMTGDGVNDGPALKAAHIGIAMGKKGSEIAKQAASLILIDDDLSKMVDAVAFGRKIYSNLKKAIQYIISIHIPIILTVFIPLALGWIYPNIFSPLHIIFMELIMGPTCSIIYENEPMEKNIMTAKPRPFIKTFFSWRELTTSIIQGLTLTIGILLTYQYAVYIGLNEITTRTMVFTALISGNIILTLVNRSFYYSIFTTIKYKNNLVGIIIGITIILLLTLIYFPPFAHFFKFNELSINQLLISAGIGFISVIWFEFVKMYSRNKVQKL